MKKKRNMVILIAVFCILLLGYFLISGISKEENSKDTEEEIHLSQIPYENIIGFSFRHYNNEEYGEETYSFSYENNIWYYDGDREFPVNQRFTDAKVQSVASIYADRVVDENPSDLSKYGLDVPYLTVTATDGTTTYTYHVGDYNPSTTTYYVQEESSGVVYLADAKLFMAFDVQIWDFLEALEKDNLPKPLKNSFTRIKLEYQDQSIELLKTKTEKDYIKDQWYLLDDSMEIIENTDMIATEQFPSLLEDLTFLREVDYKCEESEYEYYGFDQPSLIITINYMEDDAEKQYIITIGNNTVESDIYEDYYVLTNESESVFTIEFSELETLVSIQKDSLLSN